MRKSQQRTHSQSLIVKLLSLYFEWLLCVYVECMSRHLLMCDVYSGQRVAVVDLSIHKLDADLPLVHCSRTISNLLSDLNIPPFVVRNTTKFPPNGWSRFFQWMDYLQSSEILCPQLVVNALPFAHRYVCGIRKRFVYIYAVMLRCAK